MLGIVKEKTTKLVDIAGISGLIFSLNIYYKGNTIFIISLYEINRILESYKEKEEEPS
jgi:hypothetical protein